MHIGRPALIAALLLFGLAQPCRSEGAIVTDCDRLAAHEWDPERVASGVPWARLDKAALEACRAAVAANPAEPRLAYQLGRVLDRLGYLDEALAVLRASAETGYAQAAYALGTIHAESDGLVRDLDEAARWWRRAAARDHSPSLAALAMLHLEGAGVSKDPNLAFIDMRRAARKGFTQAQYAVGLWCLTGKPEGREVTGARTQCTPSEATMWLAVAANKGHAEARAVLEDMGKVAPSE